MQTLGLAVENRAGIDLNAVVLLDIFCKTQLVLILDVHELCLCLLVIRVYSQTLQMAQIGDPVVSDMISDPACQKRICMQQETSLGDTVGLVVKLLGEHLVELLQFLIFQDFRMQSCHTVDGITGSNCQMCHLYFSVINDRHLLDHMLIAGEACLNL